MKVHSTNEYGKLKSVVLGRPDNAVYPQGDRYYTQWIVGNNKYKKTDATIPEDVIKDSADDLFAIKDLLEDEDITIYRPEITNHETMHVDDRFETTGFNSWNSRDFLFTLDNLVIECPVPFSSKRRESVAYQDVKSQAIKDGVRWISAPTPPMEPMEAVWKLDRVQLAERYPIFIGSNILKFDDKLLYFKGSTNNEVGAKWLQSVVGSAYEVIVWDKMDPNHNLDFVINPIGKDLLLLNAERITSADRLPKFLRGYRKIWIQSCKESSHYGWPMSSAWTGMNTLCLGENKVMVDIEQKDLIKNLRSENIQCIQVSLKNAQTFGGGLHRIITDLERS